MKYRKLRIAWSVVWGVVAVLLCVLWVRSYWLSDNLVEVVPSFESQFIVSERGTVLVSYRWVTVPSDALSEGWYYWSRPAQIIEQISGGVAFCGFQWRSEAGRFTVILPDWF